MSVASLEQQTTTHAACFNKESPLGKLRKLFTQKLVDSHSSRDYETLWTLLFCDSKLRKVEELLKNRWMASFVLFNSSLFYCGRWPSYWSCRRSKLFQLLSCPCIHYCLNIDVHSLLLQRQHAVMLHHQHTVLPKHHQHAVVPASCPSSPSSCTARRSNCMSVGACYTL